MPTKASLLLDLLGVEKDQRTWADAVVGSNKTFGKSFVPVGYGKGHETSLFPRAKGHIIPATKPTPEPKRDENLAGAAEVAA
jgi:hypothetical protein